MLGDITWVRLFGKYIDLAHAHEMFSAADMDTSDLSTIEYHKELVKANNFSLLVTHTVGIDHVGHYFGKAHPTTLRKV